jgi:glycosyltransferase involved in cell wall biosynthesis
LEGTIKSVLQQTYPHVEFIIVDGASTDGTLDIVKKYESRIAKWMSEKDNGIYDGMNKALSLATGDYVLFLNCGDHLYDAFVLENIVKRISSDTDIIYGEVMMVEGEDRHEVGKMSEITPHRYPPQLTWRDMRFGMNVCHQSFFARRTLAPQYIQGNLAADIDWVIRCLKNAKQVVNTEIIISAYLMGGISKKKHRQSLKDRYEILKNHFGWLPNILAHGWIVVRAFLYKWFGGAKY